MTALPMPPLRVGVVQMQSTDNVEANIESALKAIERVSQQGCDVVVLPENALYLRLDRDGQIAATFDLKESFWRRFSELARAKKTDILIGSVALKKVGQAKPANSTIWIKSDESISAAYDKIHLFDVDVKGAPPARESESFVFGEKPAIIEIKGWRIGLAICYDMRFAELFSIYAKENVHAIMLPSAFLVPTGQAHWHVLLRARAIENQCYVIAAAQSGEHKNEKGQTRHTFGHSLVVEPWGAIVKESMATQADEFVCELNPEAIKKVREQIPMADHRRL